MKAFMVIARPLCGGFSCPNQSLARKLLITYCDSHYLPFLIIGVARPPGLRSPVADAPRRGVQEAFIVLEDIHGRMPGGTIYR